LTEAFQAHRNGSDKAGYGFERAFAIGDEIRDAAKPGGDIGSAVINGRRGKGQLYAFDRQIGRFGGSAIAHGRTETPSHQGPAIRTDTRPE
jgi:hypothetical protein